MTEAPPDTDQEQPFLSHLVELRSRLLRALAAVVVVFAGLIPFSNRLYAWISKPLLDRLPEGTSMIAIDVVTPFFIPLKLAFFCAIFIVMPYLLYQAWAFVAPGLYRTEKRLAMPLLVSASLLFYVGCAFAYFLVMPTLFAFLTATVPDGVSMATDISHFLDFVLVLFLAFGLCFEVPVATTILVALGVTNADGLRRARGYVIVGAFAVAAVVTPPDAISQIMLAIPMCVLYELGIVAARLVVRREQPNDAPAG